MRRKLRIEDARPTLDLLDVEPPDIEAFAKAIDSFAVSTQHAVEGMIALLRHDFDNRCISPDAIERLSKWCNSGATFVSAVDPACRVSQVLFGFTLERLIAEDGRREDDYDLRVAKMLTRLNS